MAEESTQDQAKVPPSTYDRIGLGEAGSAYSNDGGETFVIEQGARHMGRIGRVRPNTRRRAARQGEEATSQPQQEPADPGEKGGSM